jgi:hypothetical protein
MRSIELGGLKYGEIIVGRLFEGDFYGESWISELF